jgi:hypothetical protein
MKVYVTQLYKAGKLLPRDKKVDVFEGDLVLLDYFHPNLNRLVREAKLIKQYGLQVVDPIIDVQIVAVGLDGFRLRGVEVQKEVERVQEWFVRPVLSDGRPLTPLQANCKFG